MLSKRRTVGGLARAKQLEVTVNYIGRIFGGDAQRRGKGRKD